MSPTRQQPEVTPWEEPEPATPEQIRSEMRRFRRKAVRRMIERYIDLLLHIGNPSTWEYLEDLSVVGFLRQHNPLRRCDHDDDIIFYIDFQSALWELEPRTRVTFALRYIWDMNDAEIAAYLRCARRTVLRIADRLNDAIYERMRDYCARDEQELADILRCRF